MRNTLRSIKLWFERAIKKPEPRNQTTQLGVHLEEIAEMLDELVKAQANGDHLGLLTHQMHKVATMMKRGEIQIDPSKLDHVRFLDSLCDQVVTATGTGHVFGYAITEAIGEVDASNWSKFDLDGQPLFDENKKIIKSKYYIPPNLAKYITWH